jgi:hypothetical protein
MSEDTKGTDNTEILEAWEGSLCKDCFDSLSLLAEYHNIEMPFTKKGEHYECSITNDVLLDALSVCNNCES